MALTANNHRLLNSREQQQMREEHAWLCEAAASGGAGAGADGGADGGSMPLSLTEVSPRVLRVWVAKLESQRLPLIKAAAAKKDYAAWKRARS